MVTGNSLDNVSDGDVENSVVQRLNLDSAANQSPAQRDSRGVNEINSFTTEPRVRLVLYDEHDVRCNTAAFTRWQVFINSAWPSSGVGMSCTGLPSGS